MKKINFIFFLLMGIASLYTINAYCIDSSQNNITNLPKKDELASYDVKQFGSLAKALGVIGNKEVILVIQDEQIIKGHIIIPSNIILQVQGKGIINIGSTAKLLITGPLYAERNQIFFGSGVVSFSGGILRQIRPEWWGAKRDGISDDTRAVQATINSLSIGRGEVLFEDGTYVVNSISLSSNVSIVGNGRECVLEQKKNSKYCCSINPDNGGT
ncbi:glycosyl hydrolase family 28-related protein, partial [Geobacter sp.]|uniref:glycosyl hydrolase family 28-related protein n=1 Tax=Geobacter sp. TaxID=46610 RepID=UPI00262B231A